MPVTLVRVQVLRMKESAVKSKPSGLAADLILLHGNVLAMTDSGDRAQAIAIKDGHIAAIGADSAIEPLAGPATHTIDVGGRLVSPGLVDAHSHTNGVSPQALDLTHASCIAEIEQAVSDRAVKIPAGQWIIGAGPFMTWQGWDERRLKEKRLLSRADLDPVSPNNPVLLVKDAGHAVVLNSYAMRLANISKDTPDPRGEIMRDPKTGEPTGVLLEGSMALGFAPIPPPTQEDRIAAIRHASDQLLHWGVTTVADMSADDEAIRDFQTLYRESTEPLVSTVLCPLVPATKSTDECVQFVKGWSVVTGFGDQSLKLAALKIFTDGGITGRGAWFKQAYKGRPGYYGIPQVTRALFLVVKEADKLGWQLHFHCCGDAAAELAIEALEAAQNENHTSGRRHVLTHLYVLSSEMMARMHRLGVVAVLQPNFVYSLGEHMREALNDDQLHDILPYKSLIEAGVSVAIGADGLPQNPFYAIYSAVARVTEAGNQLAPQEAVTVMDALWAYTRGGAYSVFDEDRRGSLEPGKIADIVVFDRDLLTVPLEQVKDTQVLLTIKDGRVVFDNSRAAGPGTRDEVAPRVGTDLGIFA
jgi:predicted amidohydrolase YtcJ